MNAIVGSNTLLRLGFRRDRIILPVWVYAVAGLTVITAASFANLYPTTASRVTFGLGLTDNPALRALTGPVFRVDTIGGLTAWRMAALGGVLIGLMNTLTVVRHSRAEEEAGRLELVGAGVVGRHAALTAALLVAGVTDLVIAVITAVGLIAVGLPTTGSIALGFGLAVVGLAFAAVAALAAQLTENSRTANGMAAGAVGVAFVLRALGDSAASGGPAWLSWLSPIGWGEQVRAFADERWWVFALPVGFAVLVAGGAFALVAGRDHGAGLLPPRPGPATAAPGLRSPLRLATRLHRGSLIGWTVSFAVLGGVFGAIAQDMANLINGNPQIERIMAQIGGSTGAVNSFLVEMFGLLGLVASIYTVQAALRLRGEETEQRAEPLLATAVGRTRWAAGHIVFAAVGPVALLGAAGVMAGLAHGLRTGTVGAQVPRLLAAALVQVPASWVLAGIVVALFGLAPKLSAVSWAVVVAFLLLGEFGPLLHAPQWAMDLSPFTHLPKLPGGVVTGAPIGWLCLLAVVLTGAGIAGFRRRDLG
jgi:ABC-2 type transport system permease protein